VRTGTRTKILGQSNRKKRICFKKREKQQKKEERREMSKNKLGENGESIGLKDQSQVFTNHELELPGR